MQFMMQVSQIYFNLCLSQVVNTLYHRNCFHRLHQSKNTKSDILFIKQTFQYINVLSQYITKIAIQLLGKISFNGL